MKKYLLLLGALLVLSLYSYFGIFKPEQKQRKDREDSFLLPKKSEVSKLSITQGLEEIVLEDREGIWWVVKPHEYLADQEFIYKSFQIMKETPVINSFDFKEDHFGLNPGKAFLVFNFNDGLNKRLVVGSESAAQNNIYVLDKDSNQVHVVHNIWGQMLYYPRSRFFSSTLPITGKQVKKVSLVQGSNRVWQLSSVDAKTMKIDFKGSEFTSDKAQWIWFFRKMRDLKMGDLDFKKDQAPFKIASELIIETEKGNIRFQNNGEGSQIFVPELHVFATIEKGSVNLLSEEIQKVINSDKK